MTADYTQVAVLIPCHDEAATIESVVRDFREALPGAQVHVFDNNSGDATKDVAAAAGAAVHDVGLQGKGHVVRRMFADIDAHVYVLVDGDATYHAASAPAMIRKLAVESLDMVVGVRAAESAAAYRRGHAFGNRVLTGFLSRLFGRNCTDILSGYRVFSRRFVKSFPVFSSGFEIETELTVHALEMAMPVGEMLTSYRERPEGSASKLRTYRDGVRIARTIVRLFSTERPFAFYGTAALVLAIVAVVLVVPIVATYLETGLVPRFPTAILSTGLMITAALSFFAGLILDTVTRGRREQKALAYLQQPSTAALLRAAAAASAARAAAASPAEAAALDYQRRMAAETATYADVTDVHELPAIFHYWSNAYLRPVLETFGFSNPDEFFAVFLRRAASATAGPARIISIGAGNCDTEIRIAALLLAAGLRDFTIECLEQNPAMIARAEVLARTAGVGEHIRPLRGDFNAWVPQHKYAAIIANQSLHHVSNLEGLFDAIAGALEPHGRFVTSDMIGRNGHQRWPEALAIVQEFWRELPESYHFNVQLQRDEPEFLNWDCSQEGFEGIRAQDILPLLVERFDFEFFYAYANVIDPFVDRGFGHHFDADSPRDREFIDRIQQRDQEEILAGRITPTHLMASMRLKTSAAAGTEAQVWKHLTPAFCLRKADAARAA